MIRKILRKITGWCLTDIHNVKAHPTAMFANYCQVHNSNVGKYSSIGRYSKVTQSKIGSYCSISWDVTINAVAHDYKKLSSHSFTKRPDIGGFVKEDARTYQKVSIGNDVWIGAHAIIMPGIEIGDGAVIGAGSIVTKDVKPYEIVAGNPAKHIKYRFNKEFVQELLEIKWWEWEDSTIRKNIHLFQKKLDKEILAELSEVGRG